MNMMPWKGITITLEAYECWHDAMAGIVEADNVGWHRMDWYIFFMALFSYWWLSVFSIACFLFQLVMRKWTTSTPNVFFICTSVGWIRGTVGSCMVQVFFTMTGL